MPSGVYIRTKKHNEKNSESHKGKHHSKETIEKITKNHIGMKGKSHSDKTKEKIGRGNKGKVINVLTRKKMSDGKKGHSVSQKTREKIRDSFIMKSDEEKERIFSKIFESCKIKPNKTELLVNNIIQDIKTKEFKYVGDGQVWIGGKNPDWININGKKQVIEFFGSYWHKKEDENIRKEHFKKYGYNCLVIWERELKNEQILKEKILSF